MLHRSAMVRESWPSSPIPRLLPDTRHALLVKIAASHPSPLDIMLLANVLEQPAPLKPFRRFHLCCDAHIAQHAIVNLVVFCVWWHDKRVRRFASLSDSRPPCLARRACAKRHSTAAACATFPTSRCRCDRIIQTWTARRSATLCIEGGRDSRQRRCWDALTRDLTFSHRNRNAKAEVLNSRRLRTRTHTLLIPRRGRAPHS